MNLFAFILAASLEGVRFPGATQYLPYEVRAACVYGADTRVVFHIVDDDGKTVKDASIRAAFSMNGRNKDSVRGLTDAGGLCTMRGRSVGEVVYSVNKSGYYETHDRIWLAGTLYKAGEVKDGKWQPYGKTYDVTLKRILNPTPMISAPMNNWVVIRQTNTVMGFDFEKNDFVRPHGRGRIADFTLEFETDGKKWNKNAYNHATIRLTNPFDGFYVARLDKFSSLKTTHRADTNAVFRKVLDMSAAKDGKMKWTRKNRITEDEYLVLRTRSRVDDKGNLVSAHYSKIFGPIGFGPGRSDIGNISLNYIYNPVENDPSIESDPRASRLPEVVPKGGIGYRQGVP